MHKHFFFFISDGTAMACMSFGVRKVCALDERPISWVFVLYENGRLSQGQQNHITQEGKSHSK